MECESRREGRIKRLANRSKLPAAKTWDSFQFDRLPLHVTQQLQTLRDGSFLKRRENVLLFGKPGSGKSHALCALAEQLILLGHSMLFTLLAERYERGSVLLTSNLAFSKWDQIFKDAMTTAAAIDRLVHHSVIIELNVPSFRVETAKTKKSPRQSRSKKLPTSTF